MATATAFRQWRRQRPRLGWKELSRDLRKLPAQWKAKSSLFRWVVGLTVAGEMLLLFWIGQALYLPLMIVFPLLVAGLLLLHGDGGR